MDDTAKKQLAEEYGNQTASLLLEASHYRDFLRTFVEQRQSLHPKYSFSYYSRKCGFKSRNYLREIIVGRKRVSHKAVDRVVHAIGLKGLEARYFRLKIICDDSGHWPEDGGIASAKLGQLRLKLMQKARRFDVKAENEYDLVYQAFSLPQIYASLGDEKGATVAEISGRSAMPRGEVLKVVELMVRLGIARKENQRVIAGDPHVIFGNQQGRSNFLRYYQHLADEVKRRAASDLASGSMLFYASTFSVNRKDMPALRKRLKDVIEEFTQESEKPTGDAVSNLLVGFI